MKYFILTAITVMLFPIAANAELTDEMIVQFNDRYTEVFGTCDDAQVSSFIDTHYADNYTMTLQMPNGQARQATKEQLKLMATQGIQMMLEINGPDSNCRPDMILDKTQLQGNTGIMQTTQREELTVPQNGKMVGVRANTTCQHQITENNNTLTILKSQCVMYQK